MDVQVSGDHLLCWDGVDEPEFDNFQFTWFDLDLFGVRFVLNTSRSDEFVGATW